MKVQVSEIKGFKSLKAFQTFHTLMLGLKMLPLYQSETYEEFFARIEQMDSKGQETMIREAFLFVSLDQDEIEAILSFCKDANGVPYSKENLKNLGPNEMMECTVAVCKEIAKIKVNFVTEDEKKKLEIGPLTLDA